jgi:hypothetical protein
MLEPVDKENACECAGADFRPVHIGPSFDISAQASEHASDSAGRQP